jgi:hypothetical protein
VRELLETLEASGAAGAELAVPLAYLAGTPIELDADELKGALRRAELLLATGGDPRRALELDGRAVCAVADDLDAPTRRAALADGLDQLRRNSKGLPAVGEALRSLLGDGELAWRSYASAILADALSDDD